MDGGVRGLDGEGDRWRASEHAPLRLSAGVTFQLHPVPNRLLLGHCKLPSHTKERTHTHTLAHTVIWDLSRRKDSLKDS